MKGITLAVILVLAIVVLSLSLLIFNKLQKWECYTNVFKCQKKIGISDYVNCIYYRCLNGCDSSDAMKIALDDDALCKDTCSKKWFFDKVKSENTNFNYAYCGLKFPLYFDLKNRGITLNDVKYIDCIILYNSNNFEQIFDIESPGPLSDSVVKDKRILFIDRSIVENYEEIKNGECSALSGFVQADNVKLIDEYAYVFGTSENFIFKYFDDGSAELKELPNTRIFLSSKTYNEVKPGTIAFRLNIYQPLDNQNGIIFIQSRTGNSCKYYYHCGSEVENGEINNIIPDSEFEICNKYRFKLKGMCSNDISVPLIFNLDIVG